MDIVQFYKIRKQVINAGYGEEIVWQESATEPDTADEFMWQYIWVVISSGIKNQVARIIEQRIVEAYNNGQTISSVFGHKGKVKAIENMILNHEELFEQYLEALDKLEFLTSLSFIGNITKYHLAKNLGLDVVKPDRHLVRIAKLFNKSPASLCQKLAEQTSYRIGTIDLILWRAGNLRIL